MLGAAAFDSFAVVGTGFEIVGFVTEGG